MCPTQHAGKEAVLVFVPFWQLVAASRPLKEAVADGADGVTSLNCARRCPTQRRATDLASIQYSVMLIRGDGVTLRTQKVIQGGDNGHVGRPCEVSLAPPCPELFCELRGLCRHSYFGPRTCGRSEKPRSSKWRGPNPGFQINPSPP